MNAWIILYDKFVSYAKWVDWVMVVLLCLGVGTCMYVCVCVRVYVVRCLCLVLNTGIYSYLNAYHIYYLEFSRYNI